MLTKIYDSALQLEEGSRTVVAIISTDAVDRDGVLKPRGHALSGPSRAIRVGVYQS